MPSASSKPENKTSLEVESPIKQAIGVVDRKVRNLEKRKGKLDAYREKLQAGDELNQDQKIAMQKYDVVVQSLDFARELQKQFAQISTDADKMLRKQMKKEKSERQNMELKRIQELLEVQAILDHMGSDDVREHFRTGQHGAVQLNEENLESLDKLYKLISPSRDGQGSYAEELTKASEHIVNFLDSKEKEVIGKVTYKDLKELVTQINNCGYFDKMPGSEEESAPVVANEVATEEPASSPEEPALVTQIVSETQINDDFYNTATENQQEKKQEDSDGFEFVAAVETQETTTGLPQEYVPVENNTEHASNLVDDAFFSTGEFPNQRPLTEIVSSVQGNFNFLQDSEIDLESPQHLDPAVVAAHPMAPSVPTMAVTQSTEASRQQSYQSSSLLTEEQSQQHSSQQQNQTDMTQTAATGQSGLSSSLDPSAAVFVSEQSQLESSYTSQGFNNIVSQTLPATTQHSYSTDQSMALGQTTPSFPGSITSTDASDMPPAIPMPNQTNSLDSQQLPTEQQVAQSQHSGSEEKKFTMNADAAVFKSMYSQPTFPDQSQMDEDRGFGQDGYQGSGGMNYSGGYKGGRGGSRGRGRGTSNGFSRGGRGGSFGGNYGGNRGNYNNSRGGNRGGYQGYPPRTDYRPEGYQGSNNGFGGFGAKRGGGGMRGGTGNRGAPRGAPRGGNPRGRGGFNRPGSGPQQ